MQNSLETLSDWYKSNCDGNWEHRYGIRIETLDNPGWSIHIDLSGTDLEDHEITECEEHRSENDWIVIQFKADSQKREYRSCGGPKNLEEMIQRFIEWANRAKKATP